MEKYGKLSLIHHQNPTLKFLWHHIAATIWAARQQNQQSGKCAQRRLFTRTAKNLIRLGRCPGWSESLLSFNTVNLFTCMCVTIVLWRTVTPSALLVNYIYWASKILPHETICSQLAKVKYSCSHEFHQIICPLNKHRQNKQKFGKIFKIHVFEVDINTNVISCNCYVKINKMSWNKGE